MSVQLDVKKIQNTQTSLSCIRDLFTYLDKTSMKVHL